MAEAAKSPEASEQGQREAPVGERAVPARTASRWLPLLVFFLILILAAAGVFILIKGQ
jgi:hypothetical protein